MQGKLLKSYQKFLYVRYNAHSVYEELIWETDRSGFSQLTCRTDSKASCWNQQQAALKWPFPLKAFPVPVELSAGHHQSSSVQLWFRELSLYPAASTRRNRLLIICDESHKTKRPLCCPVFKIQQWFNILPLHGSVTHELWWTVCAWYNSAVKNHQSTGSDEFHISGFFCLSK